MRASILTLFVLSLLASLPLSGQNLFDIGLKGGLNRDDLSTRYGHDALLGGNAGVFMRVKPPILPGVQGEVLLSSLGAHVRVQGAEADLRSLSVQLPLFLILAIGPVELHGGAYYERYLTKNIVDQLHADVEGQPVQLADLADDGYGALAGAGLRLGHFYAGVRYNYGFDAIGTGPFLGEVKNRQIQAYIGLGFFTPKK